MGTNTFHTVGRFPSNTVRTMISDSDHSESTIHSQAEGTLFVHTVVTVTVHQGFTVTAHMVVPLPSNYWALYPNIPWTQHPPIPWTHFPSIPVSSHMADKVTVHTGGSSHPQGGRCLSPSDEIPARTEGSAPAHTMRTVPDQPVGGVLPHPACLLTSNMVTTITADTVDKSPA